MSNARDRSIRIGLCPSNGCFIKSIELLKIGMIIIVNCFTSIPTTVYYLMFIENRIYCDTSILYCLYKLWIYFRLCHPGPCPPCNAYISKHCNCRRSYQKVKCSKQVGVKCAQTCNKLKNCSIHRCDVVCHSGNCSPCDQTVIQGR